MKPKLVIAQCPPSPLDSLQPNPYKYHSDDFLLILTWTFKLFHCKLLQLYLFAPS